MAQRSSPNVSPSLRAIVCSTSTKWSDAETSWRMSTMATRWSRSRCSSATRARRRASSSLAAGDPSVGIAVDAGFVCSIVGGLVLVELVAVEPDHPVAAGLLGHVQRIVGHADERVTVADLRVWPPSHPEAGRPLRGAAREGECMALHVFPHPLGERHGGVEHRAGEEQHELLAAIAPHPVDLARLVLQDGGELLEHLVPR